MVAAIYLPVSDIRETLYTSEAEPRILVETNQVNAIKAVNSNT
jgi:hypothetical protein